MDALTPFSLTGPLPSGTTVLEASAGTGKTYAIAALAVRYVAEAGVALSELLLVTFTRAATAELGDRVRRRLADAATHLGRHLAGATAGSGDPLLDHLAAAPPAELARRHARLVEALTTFDTATIATIHAFSQQVLRTIGLAAATDRDAVLLEDEEELQRQVLADLVVARFHDHAGAPTPATLHAALREAARVPDAVVAPRGAPTVLPPLDVLDALDDPELQAALDDPEEEGRRIATLVRDARDELARRKRAGGWLSQDDLLTRLRDALVDPRDGAAAVAALRRRIRVALVDEFQDTDPVQWEILRTALASPGDGRALVLIGDPKQAIYGFRGADVRSYLDATTTAGARFGLATNWRSDGPLVAALDGLLAGTTYGEARIVHRPVEAAPSHAHARIAATDPADAAPLELRVVTRVGDDDGPPAAGRVREQLLPADVASEVVRTLQDRGVTIDGRPVRPGDVAVLVRSNRDAAAIQRALRDAHVPSVLNGVGNVLASEGAAAWQALLDAVGRPADAWAARRLAAAGLVGWDADRLATASEEELGALHGQIADWAGVLQAKGVAALLRAVATATRLPERLLAHAGGERLLTDVQHVAELLERIRRDDDLGAGGLRAWLRDARADAGEAEVPPDAQARRLESDADAVQLLTIHRAKGLEFPIVLCPTSWSAGAAQRPPVTLHDPVAGRRVVDVGPKERPGATDALEQAAAVQQGEDLRLLYVALTRARHRVVVWWVANDRNAGSALGRVLFSRQDGRVVAGAPTLPDREHVVGALDGLVTPLRGRVVEVPPRLDVPTLRPTTREHTVLEAARLRGEVDHTWRRTSYSALTATLGHGHDVGARAVGSDVAAADDALAAVKDDEVLVPGPVLPDVPTARVAARVADEHAAVRSPDAAPLRADDGRVLAEVDLPLAAVPGSTELGTMVHAVLEHADFAAADLGSELAHHLEREAERAGAREDRVALLDGLVAAVTTPLGPIAAGRALRDITRADRLDEPRFELPVAGGDRHPDRPALTLAAIADLLGRHLPADDPLADYPELLRGPDLTVDVRGYLNGAIDLVLRVPDDAGTPRYLVVDHKTNRLGWPEAPTALHYRPAALATAMMHGHYPLQALLYSVALHRLLRWRQPGYDPDRHLGGIAYLFLRGMTGPDVPHVDGLPCGVFAWRPPTALVLDLDALVAGRPDDGSDACA